MQVPCVVLWSAAAALLASVCGGDESGGGEEGYCDARHRALCRKKGPHVACQYPHEGPGSACESYSALRMSRDLRLFITHYINRRRQRLAEGRERGRGGATFPSPQVMMLVEWDDELAYLAQRLADQCQFAHDQCRATVRYPFAGQTVGEVRWRRAPGRAVRRVLDAWWGERKNASPRDLTSPFRVTSRMSWGHFSQMAVWSLRAVGCGASLRGAGAADDDRDARTLLLVCDFSHNNMLGQATVRRGARAPCPAHTARRPHSPYPLLCAALSPSEGPADDARAATTAEPGARGRATAESGRLHAAPSPAERQLDWMPVLDQSEGEAFVDDAELGRRPLKKMTLPSADEEQPRVRPHSTVSRPHVMPQTMTGQPRHFKRPGVDAGTKSRHSVRFEQLNEEEVFSTEVGPRHHKSNPKVEMALQHHNHHLKDPPYHSSEQPHQQPLVQDTRLPSNQSHRLSYQPQPSHQSHHRSHQLPSLFQGPRHSLSQQSPPRSRELDYLPRRVSPQADSLSLSLQPPPLSRERPHVSPHKSRPSPHKVRPSSHQSRPMSIERPVVDESEEQFFRDTGFRRNVGRSPG